MCIFFACHFTSDSWVLSVLSCNCFDRQCCSFYFAFFLAHSSLKDPFLRFSYLCCISSDRVSPSTHDYQCNPRLGANPACLYMSLGCCRSFEGHSFNLFVSAQCPSCPRSVPTFLSMFFKAQNLNNFLVTVVQYKQFDAHPFKGSLNTSSLAFEPSCVLFICVSAGTPRPDSIPEVGEDAVTTVGQGASSIGLTEEEQEELRNELVKVNGS